MVIPNKFLINSAFIDIAADTSYGCSSKKLTLT